MDVIGDICNTLFYYIMYYSQYQENIFLNDTIFKNKKMAYTLN